MVQLGFSLTEVQDRLKDGEGIIHRDAPCNHLKRILIAQSERAFYEHAALIRNRERLGGGAYGAGGCSGPRMRVDANGHKRYY